MWAVLIINGAGDVRTWFTTADYEQVEIHVRSLQSHDTPNHNGWKLYEVKKI